MVAGGNGAAGVEGHGEPGGRARRRAEGLK